MPEPSIKVLHVLDHFLPYHSGYTYRSLSVFGSLQKIGRIEQIILTSAKHKKFDREFEFIKGFATHHTVLKEHQLLKRPLLRELYEMSALYKKLVYLHEKEDFDILHVHSPVLNALPALLLSWHKQVPLLYDIRAFWEDAAASFGKCSESSVRYRVTKSLETHVAKKADRVSVICDGLRRDLIARGVQPEKISIQPNGLESYNSDGNGIRRKDHLSNCFTIGYIGSFYQYEGLDILIDAMERLSKTGQNYRLLLVGGYEEEHHLRQKTKELNLDKAIHFTGPVPHDKIDQYYSQMDLLVYPRRRQRLTELVTPLKPLEAMSHGKVVLASDVGGHRELIQDGKNGLLFRADDIEDLTCRVQSIAGGEHDLDGISKNALYQAQNERKWDRIVQGYLSIYGDLQRQENSRHHQR